MLYQVGSSLAAIPGKLNIAHSIILAIPGQRRIHAACVSLEDSPLRRRERPLIDQALQTNGLDLFVERYGQLINVSREGQQAMKEFTRDTESDTMPRSDPRVVVMTPLVSFGRPVIAGTGIPVSAVYERYKAGD